MDRETLINTLEELLTLVDKQYVFPEMAVSIRSELNKRLMNQEYDQIVDANVRAEALTKHLQEITHDKHLRIRYSLDTILEKSSSDKRVQKADAFQTMLQFDNYGFQKVERLPGNIGLLQFTSFAPPEFAGETASSAMTFLSNTSGLILDLRKNFGGSPFMVALLSSYLLEPKPTHLNDLYWRKNEETHQFWSLPYVPGRRFGGKKLIYILTSRQTFSAAEEFTYNLQVIERATVVGERTGGRCPSRRHAQNQ